MSDIAITGRGVVSSIGLNIDDFEQAILDGHCGIKPIPFDTTNLNFKWAASVKEFVPEQHFDDRSLHRMDRFSQFSVVAARQAMNEAGLTKDIMISNSDRIGVIIGTANGGSDILDLGFRRIYSENKNPLPLTVPMTMASAPASHIAKECYAKGPVFSVNGACASASHAIALAMMFIKNKMVDIVITGGTDSCVFPSYLKAWNELRVVSSFPCSPFGLERSGLTIGEGAAIVVIEDGEFAKKRGISHLVNLKGAGITSDANDLLAPDHNGMFKSMQIALSQANLTPHNIDYINAHGTGTILNDLYEAMAIRQLFGDYADELPVSATKSIHGHAMGATGAIEVLATIAAINHSFIPPTINVKKIDPNCHINLITNKGKSKPVNIALSNSFGFGGLNVSLLLAKPKE